jgi:hypothetical protein
MFSDREITAAHRHETKFHRVNAMHRTALDEDLHKACSQSKKNPDSKENPEKEFSLSKT